MVVTYRYMDNVATHRHASPYGIQKPDYEYLAHMFYTDHVDGDVFNIVSDELWS